MIYQRLLNMNSLLQKKSFFLFGPRSTGKTTLIHQQFPNAIFYDLLDADIYTELLRRPKLIEEKLVLTSETTPIIIIDEIQKLPKLLDEVHRLIEKYKISFLLTGSSARKLKRGAANLLGGRAWEAHLYGLTSKEIINFDLIKYLNRGGLPHIFLSEDYYEELNNYINLYIREEVVAEALVRKLDYFIRFLDIIGLQNGEELHFQSISSDAGVPVKTIQNYIQILEDTLIGFQLPAYLQTKKRKAITRSKFYFFDIGIVNTLAKRTEILSGSELFGKVFEHFLVLEIRAYLNYRRKNITISYWRSTSQFEVDCIIGNNLACEFKSTTLVTEKHLKGLKALREEQNIQKFCIVSQDSEMRIIDGIQVYPWKNFLNLLWLDQLI
ncbi:MAG: AAA family ATPase [Gammaproteobacteria bacterium]